MATANQPADGKWIEKENEALQALRQLSDTLNFSWVDLTKAIMILQTGGKVDLGGKTLTQKKVIAEDEATKMRNIAKHIRRGWFKNAKAPWMSYFPRASTAERRMTAMTAPQDWRGTAPQERRVLSRMASLGSADSTSDVEILNVDTANADDDQFEISSDEENVDIVYGCDIRFDGADAYRQLCVNGERIGVEDKAVRIHQPKAVGNEYIAEFVDGSFNTIPGHIRIARQPSTPPPTQETASPTSARPPTTLKRPSAATATPALKRPASAPKDAHDGLTAGSSNPAHDGGPADANDEELGDDSDDGDAVAAVAAEDLEESEEDTHEQDEAEEPEDVDAPTIEPSIGHHAVIHDLVTRQDLNKGPCRLVKFDDVKQRWLVRTLTMTPEECWLKSENLTCHTDMVWKEHGELFNSIRASKDDFVVRANCQGSRPKIISMYKGKTQVAQVSSFRCPINIAFEAMLALCCDVMTGKVDPTNKTLLKDTKEAYVKKIMIETVQHRY
jgi:hypothetical protein